MKRVSGGAVKEDTIEIQGDHREKVAERGSMRQCGRPWAWTDPKNGKRRRADNRLHGIFHNPFYAGWVVSDRFGIPYGEVRSRISQLRQEEARLGRLLVTGKLSEAAYDQLREEWSEKIQNAERILADIERETTLYLDDLDAALAVLNNIKKPLPTAYIN